MPSINEQWDKSIKEHIKLVNSEEATRLLKYVKVGIIQENCFQDFHAIAHFLICL